MRRCLLALFTVLVFAHAGAAAAQSDPGRDAEARGLFEAGRAAFDQGRYQDALGYFDRAYQLSRRPQLLYNLGQVHDRLRHDEEALTAFQQYLKQVPGAENRAEVEHRIQAMRQAMYGSLHFTLSPANAEVWIDGEAKPLDATGRLQVTTGSHEILVRAEGHDEVRQRMNVRGGDMIELPISLQPNDGSAPVATAPAVIAPVPAPVPTTAPPVVQDAPPVQTAPAEPAPTPAVAEAPAPTQANYATLPDLPTRGGSTATTLAWVAVVPAGLLLAAGTGFALLGSSEFDKINDECRSNCSREEIENKGETLKTYELITNVGFIGGGLLAAAATVLFIVGGNSNASEQPPAPPAVAFGPGSIIAQGSF